jgi:hypothetical protein
MHLDDDSNYHSNGGYVYTPRLALELRAVWEGVDAAETAGVPLDEISRALSFNWSVTVTALALRNLGTLRALVREAGS